ncbi:MAG TPA: DUF1573 domain-containing protein [Kiritimatiellia bacterium]|nr:DUF1573 domain-containing protein [Kiritimatiellia bacterium]HMO98961.1 DUF1573 domain-containing protein [Kiritimatiellia bacterium]HMP96415.1 DUF1573 domain-containing protein [Kiritimatiellia bacterium]
MRKNWIVVLAAACLACGVSAEEAPVVQGPRIFSAEPEFNFGTVDNQTQIEHTFVVKNIGDTTLEINNVRAACGCTVADMSSRSIEPGQEATLTARLNLQGRTGFQSKPITLHSNDPENPQFRLNMVGNAQASVQVSPERLMFGQIGPGQDITLPVEVRNLSPDPMAILGVESAIPQLVGEVETIEEGRHYNISVSLRELSEPGSFNGVLRVLTDHPQRPTIDIAVFANVVGDLIYAPPEIVLPAHTDGNPLTRFIVIRPGATPEFEVTKVEVPDPEMKVSIFPFGGQGYRIQIENIQPDEALDGKAFRVLTTAPFMSEIAVPVRIAR